MYNLIEYSSNYSKSTGSLWFYSKDEATDFNVNITNTDDIKYKAKLYNFIISSIKRNY